DRLRGRFELVPVEQPDRGERAPQVRERFTGRKCARPEPLNSCAPDGHNAPEFAGRVGTIVPQRAERLARAYRTRIVVGDESKPFGARLRLERPRLRI